MSAPIQAPATEAAISEKSVATSILTMVVKMKVSTMVGMLCPIVMVPGMMRSLTILRSLNHDVVGAYEPTPSASKKLVMKPTASCSPVGKRTSVAGIRATPGFRAAHIALLQTSENIPLNAPSAAKRPVIGFIRKRYLPALWAQYYHRPPSQKGK